MKDKWSPTPDPTPLKFRTYQEYKAWVSPLTCYDNDLHGTKVFGSGGKYYVVYLRFVRPNSNPYFMPSKERGFYWAYPVVRHTFRVGNHNVDEYVRVNA